MPGEQRSSERRPLAVAGRLTWRDARGATRFASVVTRDASDHTVFVESTSSVAIPLYRLVHLQLERDARDSDAIPPALRQGKVLSAVYRVGPYRSATGTPEGYALRLLIESDTRAAERQTPARSIA